MLGWKIPLLSSFKESVQTFKILAAAGRLVKKRDFRTQVGQKWKNGKMVRFPPLGPRAIPSNPTEIKKNVDFIPKMALFSDDFGSLCTRSSLFQVNF